MQPSLMTKGKRNAKGAQAQTLSIEVVTVGARRYLERRVLSVPVDIDGGRNARGEPLPPPLPARPP